jgi:hypothetical protein
MLRQTADRLELKEVGFGDGCHDHALTNARALSSEMIAYLFG